jgi:hypothetical protein
LGVAYHVQDGLGLGMPEQPYQLCLADALRGKGHHVTEAHVWIVAHHERPDQVGLETTTFWTEPEELGRSCHSARPGRAALALRASAAGQGLVRWVEISAPAPQ